MNEENEEQYINGGDGQTQQEGPNQNDQAVMSHKKMREEFMKMHRKALLTKHGVIPEFIKISQIYQVYTAFTQANLKNQIIQ